MKLVINKNKYCSVQNYDDIKDLKFFDKELEETEKTDDSSLSDSVSEKLMEHYNESEFNEHYYQQNKSLKEYFFNTKSTKNSLWFLFVYLLVFITINYLISNYILFGQIFNSGASISNNYLIWSNSVTRTCIIVFFLISFILTLFSNIGFLITSKSFKERLVINSIIQFFYLLVFLFEFLSFLHIDLFSNDVLADVGYGFSFFSWNDNLLFVAMFIIPILIYLLNCKNNFENKKTVDIKKNNLVYFIYIISIVLILFVTLTSNLYDNVLIDSRDNYSVITNVVVIVLSILAIILGVNSKSVALELAEKFSKRNYRLAFHCFNIFFFLVKVLSIMTLALSLVNIATTLWNYLSYKAYLNNNGPMIQLNYSGIILTNFTKISNINLINDSFKPLTTYRLTFGYSISSFIFVLLIFLILPVKWVLLVYDKYFITLNNKHVGNQIYYQNKNTYINSGVSTYRNNDPTIVDNQSHHFLEEIKRAYELVQQNVLTGEEFKEIKRKIIEKI